MRVILKETIEFLGNVGDVVEVKPGYARNYLLPKVLVMVADQVNVKAWEHQKRIVEDRIRKLRLSARALAEQLQGQMVEVAAKAGETDRLFGSVGSSDIQKALRGKGFSIPRKDIQLSRPIKALGDHPVTVRLHPDVNSQITVRVVRSADSPEPAPKRTRTDEILEAVAKAEEAESERAEEAEEAKTE